MNTLTPISDSEVICSEPHGYLTVAYCVAQKLEVENAALKIDLESWKAIADNWRVKAVEWSRENAALKQQVAMLRKALKELAHNADMSHWGNVRQVLAATEPKGELE